MEIWPSDDVEIVKQSEGSDPAAVVFDSLQAGKARGRDVIICDTAGRLHNKKHLMDELAKIRRVIDRELPGADVEVLLVLDATTGQNALNQAKQFKEATGLGSSPHLLDGTAKEAWSSASKRGTGPHQIHRRGRGHDDLRPFDPAQFAAAMFAPVETRNPNDFDGGCN